MHSTGMSHLEDRPSFIEIDEITERLRANIDDEHIVPYEPLQESSFSEVEQLPSEPFRHTQETDTSETRS